MMDKNQVLPYLNQHNVLGVKFAFADIDGILRGKLIHTQKFIDGLTDGYGFCDVVFGWDSSDRLYDQVDVTGWHTGYPDQPCYIDLSTFRTVPWQQNLPFFLADFSGDREIQGAATGNRAICPRSLLKKIASDAERLGFHAEFAQEFEWFNFQESPESLRQKGFSNLQPLSPGMYGYSILRPSQHQAFYSDLFTQLAAFDIPLEGLHTETGPGVYEAAIIHDQVLAAADKAVLLKNAVKEIASKHGLVASFMAKWSEDLPGCSGHLHQSLWDKKGGTNLFFDEGAPNHMSKLMQHYLAGQLHCLPHLLPMYAPTVNSYKRLVEGAWAPTTTSWGVENRTTAFRVIPPSAAYTRLETRIPGSDSNPYLAMSAALASGLYGIRHQLPLDIPATIGTAYGKGSGRQLPGNLLEATHAMHRSDLARELFGDAFTDHFTKTRFWEWNQFNHAVTNWELQRYFEII